MLHGLTKKPVTQQGDQPQPKPKDNAPAGGVSPRGDLAALSDKEQSAMFKRPIKKAGPTWHSAQWLPYRKPDTAIDSQFGPGDKAS